MNSKKETVIGSRDLGYNTRQYNDPENTKLYNRLNPEGLRGGYTPAIRVGNIRPIAPPGSRVLEIGPGAGLELIELDKAGYKPEGADISWPFIERIREMGFPAIYFDAATDPIPDGFDAVYAHLSLFHIRPIDLVRLLASCRNNLQGPRAFYASFLDGAGHERSKRNEEFDRYFNYYSRERLRQMCHAEGLDLMSIEKVTAFNGSEFWHILGTFTAEYEGGSYGMRGLQPFGDTIWVPNALCKGNLIYEILDDQVRVGLLAGEVRDFIKAAEDTYLRSHIDLDQMMKEINNKWAEGLIGQEVSTVMQHTWDFLDQHPRLGPLTEAALAVCYNNGFSNILIGYEPSWLLKVLSERLRLDQVVTSVQWRTDRTQFTGKITGDVFYVDDNPNPKVAVLRHQNNLRRKLDLPYKRITIGVGQSMLDAAVEKEIDVGFLASTDYPLFAQATWDNTIIAKARGVFPDRQGDPIHADDKFWYKWKATENGAELVTYLNMITSGRFPVEPNLSDYKTSRLAWECPNNTLNEDFYKANQEIKFIIE